MMPKDAARLAGDTVDTMVHRQARRRARQSSFDPALTAPAVFVGVDGKSGDAAMMRLGQAIAFRLERKGEDSFVAIDSPFVEKRFSLVVVTTADRRLQQGTSRLPLRGSPAQASRHKVGDLAMPRFSAWGREDLMPALDALGLDKARHAATVLQGSLPAPCCLR
jgi:hypothetical protein